MGHDGRENEVKKKKGGGGGAFEGDAGGMTGKAMTAGDGKAIQKALHCDYHPALRRAAKNGQQNELVFLWRETFNFISRKWAASMTSSESCYIRHLAANLIEALAR